MRLRIEGLREALTSTGNAYFCTRGFTEWEDADGGGLREEGTRVGRL